MEHALRLPLMGRAPSSQCLRSCLYSDGSSEDICREVTFNAAGLLCLIGHYQERKSLYHALRLSSIVVRKMYMSGDYNRICRLPACSIYAVVKAKEAVLRTIFAHGFGNDENRIHHKLIVQDGSIMCLQRRKYLVSRASGLTHSGIGPVYDITMPLFNGRPPQIHQRIVDNLNELDSGNLLQRSRELDVTRLRRITVKSAEALLSAHAEGLVHGCVWPGAFCLTEDSITLLDVGLYKLKQIHQDNIPVGSAQHYKAREELKMSPVDPTQAMDIHSWGKTIISLYTHLPFITSLSNIVPPIPPRPQEMPDDIWNIVVQCLSEYLDIGVTMEDVVYQLTGI